MKTTFSWMLIIGLSLFTSLSSAAAKNGDIHGDWGTKCEADATGVEACFIFQTLTTKDTKQRVFQMSVGYPTGSDNITAIFTAPLGIALIPGVAIKIDEAAPIKMQVAICDREGCKAVLPLNEETLTAMKKGNRIIFSFIDPKGKNINLGISLKGFTAAYNSIKK